MHCSVFCCFWAVEFDHNDGKINESQWLSLYFCSECKILNVLYCCLRNSILFTYNDTEAMPILHWITFFSYKILQKKKKHGSIRKNNNKNGSIKLFFTSRSQRAMDVCLKQTERTVVHKQAQLIVAGHRDSPWGINIIFMYTQWKQILLHMQFHATTHSYSKSAHTALRLSVFCSSSLLPCSLDSVRACSTVNKLL